MAGALAAIGDVRGLGAMLAIELVHDRETKEPAPELATAVVEAAAERGLLLLKAGHLLELHPRARPARRSPTPSSTRRSASGKTRSSAARSAQRRAVAHVDDLPAAMVGEVIAERYELEELVGTGGMSSVYRAHDRCSSGTSR